MNSVLTVPNRLSWTTADYAIRLAAEVPDIRAAQALRFEVFNLELDEGLESSLATGLDADPFDEVCDHIIVEHRLTGRVVGTYRLQTGRAAAAHLGYYSSQEFDLGVFESVREETIELGRACVHRAHRNFFVLGLLWKAIASYALEHGGRYLCGCSSLTSQDPRVGASAYTGLYRRYLAAPRWRTSPVPEFTCPIDHLAENAPEIPKLLRTYLSVGAKICGPPAIDRQFRTIDFLTLLDLHTIPRVARDRFLG